VGYLSFEHQAITHLTGTTSLLGAALAHGDLRAAWQLSAMILAFVAGAVLSGLLIQDSVLRLGRRYGVALGLESLLLIASVPLFQRGLFLGPVLAATAIGLQNAMATTYSGAIVRTSHVSGMFTDLGITLGHALRGLPVARRRLALCLVIISAFLAGGILGALLFGRWGHGALYLPAALTGSTGLVYAIYRHRKIDSGKLRP
jgi:uncharacterized membrane protein YoaK (UPF0700 family)